MTTAEIIQACSDKAQRPFLMIGGHAVIAYGHSRNTVDLDLLARKADRQTWETAVMAIDYQAHHAHENFTQYQSMKGDIDLDLMFVNAATFESMFATSREICLDRTTVRIPSLDHLIALKLHVLKQGLEHRMLRDLDDVIQLALVNRLELDQFKWQAIFERYGNKELYEKVRRATRSG